MKILELYPPNIKEIEKKFDLTGLQPVFAFGNVIFNPHNIQIDQFLLTHEMTHQKQQGNRPMEWWEKYLSDPLFRMEQELEAYRNQYSLFCKKVTDGNKRARYLHGIAISFSSKMYGNIISYSNAIKYVKNR